MAQNPKNLSPAEEIRDGLKEIKAIKSGQIQATSLEDFIKELQNDRKNKIADVWPLPC